jgi:hypothetical protein
MYGNGRVQESSPQNLLIEPFIMDPPLLNLGGAFGKVGRQQNAKSSCGLQFEISVGLLTAWLEEDCRILTVVCSVIKKMKMFNIFSQIVFLLGSFGSES